LNFKILIPVEIKNKFVPAHAMKAYGGLEIGLYTFLTSALCGVAWSFPHPGHFIIGEASPIPFEENTGWVPDQVSMLPRGDECLSSVRNRNTTP
jgi:hypothetical protein